jgi:hypothetical protein
MYMIYYRSLLTCSSHQRVYYHLLSTSYLWCVLSPVEYIVPVVCPIICWVHRTCGLSYHLLSTSYLWFVLSPVEYIVPVVCPITCWVHRTCGLSYHLFSTSYLWFVLHKLHIPITKCTSNYMHQAGRFIIYVVLLFFNRYPVISIQFIIRKWFTINI